MRPIVRVLMPAAVLLLATLAAPAVFAQSVGYYNGLASTDFTQCYSRAECVGADPCQSDELVLDGNCNANCFSGVSGDPPFNIGGYNCFCSVDGKLAWEVGGWSGHGFDDVGFPVGSRIVGARVAAESFRVQGYVQRSPPAALLPTQFAVFRFDGDPSIFDGVEARSVHDLVAQGLIADSDILWTAVYEGPDDDFDELVDVTGIPDDEIVVFAASTGYLPIPAVTTWGAVLLAVLILALTPLALRLRRNSA